MTFYAHSGLDPDRECWQELREHLDAVAILAAEFASEAWKSLAHVAGLWHDAGKYQIAFQRYIGVTPEASNESNPAIRSVPHSAAGAVLAVERFGLHEARGLALVIEAHHGALKAGRAIADVLKQRGNVLLASAREGGLPPGLEQADAAALLPSRTDQKPWTARRRQYLPEVARQGEAVGHPVLPTSPRSWERRARARVWIPQQGRSAAGFVRPPSTTVVDQCCFRRALETTGFFSV
jgi:CRISPR-associated endonuclease Cas3-HD